MADTRTIELDSDRSIHALTAGEGRDILLIHGALATHCDWLGPPLEALAQRGRVTAIDRPGHGGSRRLRLDAGPRAQAGQIHAAFNDLGLDRPLVVGHSFGGLVALALAELFPDAVSGLVLLAPIAFPEIRPLEQLAFGPRAVPIGGPALAALMTRSFDRPLLEMAHHLMFAPDAPPSYWKARYPWDDVLDVGKSVAEGEDSASVHPLAAGQWIDFTRLAVPTLVVAGKGDAVVRPERHAIGLADALPNGRLRLLKGAGHMLHHSRVEAVLAAVDEMLAAC